MQTFSLFCLLCCFPALFCYRLGSELGSYDESESDVAEFEQDDSLTIDPSCTCDMNESKCVCNATESYHGYHVSVELKIERALGGCSCGCPKVKAVFRVGNFIFAKIINMNKSDKVVCNMVFGKKYCFRFNIQRDYGVSGCIQMTEPAKLFMGCFHLAE